MNLYQKSNQANVLSLMSYSVTIILVSFLSTLPGDLRADHDHDHFYVEMVDYLGHDESGLHIVKVNHVYDGHPHIVLVYLSNSGQSLNGHRGDTLQISLSNDGERWARLSLKNHGTWTIHHTVAVD